MNDDSHQEDPRFSLGGAFLRGQTRGAVGLGGAFVWLAFVLFPLINAVGRRGPELGHWLAVAGAAGFVAAYVLLVLSWRRKARASTRALLFALLIADAVALTLADRPGWGFLFTYCAACAAMIGPPPLGSLGVLFCAALAGGTAALAGSSGGAVVGFVASAAGIGLLMLLLRDLRLRNDELTEARAELARLAVAQERERFARDLHDLLGHTLSVIALKAELAGRLLPSQVSAAEREIADVEQVARTALSEVRDAVSGYRQPTLDGELAGAKMALSAAGIEAEVRRADVPLDPATEAVLAWAVREGATNVIRHSGATRCTLLVAASLTDATAEVIDNGAGADGCNGNGGHGLDGLAERAYALNGTVEAGSRSEGGFRLAVRVPVQRSAGGVGSAGPDRSAAVSSPAAASVPVGVSRTADQAIVGGEVRS